MDNVPAWQVMEPIQRGIEKAHIVQKDSCSNWGLVVEGRAVNLGALMNELSNFVINARNGDLNAYAEIVGRFQHMACRYAYSILTDHHLAEDAAQEAFIQAHRDLHKLSSPAAFPGWFRRIVFKSCDRLIRRKSLRTVSLKVASEVSAREPTPDELADKREMAAEVIKAIESLPETERVSTTLFYLNGLSQKDIAKFLDVPVTAVNNFLYRSRQKLRRRIRRRLGDEEFDRKILENMDSSCDKWIIGDDNKTPQ